MCAQKIESLNIRMIIFFRRRIRRKKTDEESLIIDTIDIFIIDTYSQKILLLFKQISIIHHFSLSLSLSLSLLGYYRSTFQLNTPKKQQHFIFPESECKPSWRQPNRPKKIEILEMNFYHLKKNVTMFFFRCSSFESYMWTKTESTFQTTKCSDHRSIWIFKIEHQWFLISVCVFVYEWTCCLHFVSSTKKKLPKQNRKISWLNPT